MTHLAFLYVRTVLQEQGSLSAAGVARILATRFTPDQVDRIVDWGVDNDCLTVDDGVLHLTERGAR